jgi:tetratricopeptide (TPR) repeat protein
VYKDALAVQQGLVQQYKDRPEFLTRLARYRNNQGMLQEAMGQTPQAEATFKATLELLSPAAFVKSPLPGPRWQYARIANNLGKMQLDQRNNAAAQPLETARELLQKLSAEFPVVPQYSQELASVLYNLGLAATNASRTDDAIATYEQAIRVLEPLRSRFPGIPALRQKLALTHVTASAALANKAPAEAETSLRKAIDELSAVLTQFPDVPEYKINLGHGHYQLAILLLSRGQPVSAVAEAERALGLHKQVLTENAGAGSSRAHVVRDLGVLGHALFAAGRFTDAQDAARQLADLSPDDLKDQLNSVGLLIRCADAASKAQDGERTAEDCLTLAVKLLANAVRAGLLRSEEPLKGPEFARLHGRDDFQKLLRALAQPPRSG